ncbi:MAG: hypothetical protein QMD46_01745 [Methanomicrobiales archaeon]|nr:hypothetical protein [Methanomicrobiales archaeon]
MQASSLRQAGRAVSTPRCGAGSSQLAGGTGRLDRTTSVARDALISGVVNADSVNGRLIGTATEFEDGGTAGPVRIR